MEPAFSTPAAGERLLDFALELVRLERLGQQLSELRAITAFSMSGESPPCMRAESPHFWLLLLSALEPRFGSVGQGFVGRGRVQESLAG
jgi:hypothetical protein